jgi:flagellar biosynthetic protein FliR
MIYFVNHFQLFLLVMVRLGAMIAIAPFFSSGVIPMRLKALLAFLVSLVIFPLVSSRGVVIPGNMGEYALLVFGNVAIGLYMGFLVSVIFSAFQLAGQFFAVQIGFGINEVLDPLGQVSVPLVGQLKNLMGTLVFLAINGHHLMISAVSRSFDLAPVISFHRDAAGGLLKYLLYSFSGMFVVALKISLPVVATVFLVTITMGVLAKAAPQMNIMMLGFPFKIMVAFTVLFLSAPLIVRVMQVSLERTFGFLTNVLVHWPK